MMNKKYIALAVISSVGVATAVNSCTAIAGTSIGVAIIKRVLLGGINKGLGIFKDKDAFLQNNLIDQALPDELKRINSTLTNLGLGNIVNKEKDYIAQTAFYTVEIARPILVNAVNNLTPQDAVRIAQGGKGVATQILREKTESQLVAAFIPKVDEKLNEFGIMNSINTALNGSNLLGSILGQGNSQNISNGGFSKLASEYLVSGLFNIIQKDEQDNREVLNNTINQNTK